MFLEGARGTLVLQTRFPRTTLLRLVGFGADVSLCSSRLVYVTAEVRSRDNSRNDSPVLDLANLTGQIAKLQKENWPLRAMASHIANWLQASGQIPNCDVIYIVPFMFR
jgi:hypothetical protein